MSPTDVAKISIPAPCEGSDVELQLRDGRAEISIHAPREGSDFPIA